MVKNYHELPLIWETAESTWAGTEQIWNAPDMIIPGGSSIKDDDWNPYHNTKEQMNGLKSETIKENIFVSIKYEGKYHKTSVVVKEYKINIKNTFIKKDSNIYMDIKNIKII